MDTNGRRCADAAEKNRGDPRFNQLMALAREGNEEAAGDLWREYGAVAGDEEEPKGV